MSFEHRALMNAENIPALDFLVSNTQILEELGIDAGSYTNSREEFRAEIFEHIYEVIDERAGWGKSYTAWDGAAEEEFSISVRGWGGVWFITGGEQFEGYFLSEAEANDAAALLASCFPPPEE